MKEAICTMITKLRLIQMKCVNALFTPDKTSQASLKGVLYLSGRFGLRPRVGRRWSSTIPYWFYFTIPKFIRLSAIWTEFHAAPFNRLSDTTHIWKPFSSSRSLRIRPMKTSLLPTQSAGIG